MRTSFSRLIAVLLFGIFLAAVPIYVFPKLADGKTQLLQQEFEGVLSLWHIDTFEGGSGNRFEFLKKRAIEFEKQNKGMLISVQSFTAEQATQKLADGQSFDLISFGAGLGESLRNILQSYTGAQNVRGDLLESGKLDGNIFALPWAMGGYVLTAFNENLALSGGDQLTAQNVFGFAAVKKIGKNSKQLYSLGAGFAAVNNPFAALAANGAKMSGNFDWNGDFDLPQYTAYENHLSGSSFAVFLGTQRDLSRLSMRQANGKLKDSQFVFLGGYTDLVQYIGYSASDAAKKQICRQFMEYLTSDKIQIKVAAIELFPVNGVKGFTSSPHSDMETALSNPLDVPNVFSDTAVLLQARQTSIAKLK